MCSLRLSRGSNLKCLTVFVTKTRFRSTPASMSAWSNRSLAGPMKGRPSRSSRFPGCSPTNITSAFGGPSLKTVCVASFHSGHAWQEAASRPNSSSLLLAWLLALTLRASRNILRGSRRQWLGPRYQGVRNGHCFRLSPPSQRSYCLRLQLDVRARSSNAPFSQQREGAKRGAHRHELGTVRNAPM